MTIGERIKFKREELNISQDELARRLGYKSRSSINKIELGLQNLNQSKIKAIADGKEIVRILVDRFSDYAANVEGVEIIVGKALDADVRPNNNDNWATLWNNRLEVLQQERFFKIGENRVSGTQYGTEAEAKAAAELRLKRYIAKECSSKSKTFTGEAIEIAKRVIRRKFGANRIATAYVMVFKYDNAYCVSYRDRTYRLR